jgi:5'-deoxynucleotidase YfbR-like HD superfamily hydrolase
MTTATATAWIQTYTGHAFPVLAPSPHDIDILDIAHALSNIGRFGGHSKSFLSVAQHSVLVSRHVPEEFALAALLHDAAEAYVGDMVRPLKHSEDMAGFRDAEQRVWIAICLHFGLPYREHLPKAVKDADNRALYTEQRDLMGRPPKPWKDYGEPFEELVFSLLPKEAEKAFLDRYTEIKRGLKVG